MYWKDYIDNYRESPNEKFSDNYLNYAKSVVKNLKKNNHLIPVGKTYVH